MGDADSTVHPSQTFRRRVQRRLPLPPLLPPCHSSSRTRAPSPRPLLPSTGKSLPNPTCCSLGEFLKSICCSNSNSNNSINNISSTRAATTATIISSSRSSSRSRERNPRNQHVHEHQHQHQHHHQHQHQHQHQHRHRHIHQHQHQLQLQPQQGHQHRNQPQPGARNLWDLMADPDPASSGGMGWLSHGAPTGRPPYASASHAAPEPRRSGADSWASAIKPRARAPDLSCHPHSRPFRGSRPSVLQAAL